MSNSNKPKVEPKPKAEAPKAVGKPKEAEAPKEEIKPADNPPEHNISDDVQPAVKEEVKEPVKTPKEDVAEPAVEKQKQDDELDIQDGRRLDQNVEAAEFDENAEEKAAHAHKPHVPDHVKHAVVNPNGTGSEWPRG